MEVSFTNEFYQQIYKICKKHLHFGKKYCIVIKRQLSDTKEWLVGQAVKTSPSHGENTSSILVLAARNFRSDSEVFLLYKKICGRRTYAPSDSFLLCEYFPRNKTREQPSLERV